MNVVLATTLVVASFPGLLHLQFLISCTVLIACSTSDQNLESVECLGTSLPGGAMQDDIIHTVMTHPPL